MLPKTKQIFLVYTQRRMDAGQRPYAVGGYSASQVTVAWQRRYNEKPVKVVRGVWDARSGQYKEA